MYSKGNEIDFKKMNKFVNLSDKNYSGKSCLIDVIFIAIYGTCNRIKTKNEIINNG